MGSLQDSSVDLVVTSPPYPMIAMWDSVFGSLDPHISGALEDSRGDQAFTLMHSVLNRAWEESMRVARPGGIICINVGDATRTFDGTFRLFPSHSVISEFFRARDFTELPSVIWSKPSNSPNKFLGSGTLPVGAYVTLEHEYILIFRKPGRRQFDSPERKALRRESAFFWEERNAWFSDMWKDLRGVRQSLGAGNGRSRSAAFPFQLAFRLVNMYSVAGDTVLDPFMGTGTTSLAAAASMRNSVGYEIDPGLAAEHGRRLSSSMEFLNRVTGDRLAAHREFVENEYAGGKEYAYRNSSLGFPVKTRAEVGMALGRIDGIADRGNGLVECVYSQLRA